MNRQKLLEKLKRLSKDNMELKNTIYLNNPVKCCRCIEVDVWKQRAFTLSEIVFRQKKLIQIQNKMIERLKDDLMYLTP